MRRGDLVTIAMQGDFGNHGPPWLFKLDQFSEHASANYSAHYQYACFRAIAAHHYSAERRKTACITGCGQG